MMLYSNECYKCPYRFTDIEPEEEKAKEFYRENGVEWRFSCGAGYYPPMMNTIGVEVLSDTL
jgi:hypothetical protein